MPRAPCERLYAGKHGACQGHQEVVFAVAVEVARHQGVTGAITRYLHLDHQGSIETLTTSTGSVDLRESFTPFGERRGASTWTLPLPGAEGTSIGNVSRRGFTFHESLAISTLIHMNGRAQDPVSGRFISPDPYITDPLSTQAFNPYSYVKNRPLTFADPSGFNVEGDGENFWDAFDRWQRNVWDTRKVVTREKAALPHTPPRSRRDTPVGNSALTQSDQAFAPPPDSGVAINDEAGEPVVVTKVQFRPGPARPMRRPGIRPNRTGERSVPRYEENLPGAKARRYIPGGGLRANERLSVGAKSPHVIEQHVGRTLSQLRGAAARESRGKGGFLVPQPQGSGTVDRGGAGDAQPGALQRGQCRIWRPDSHPGRNGPVYRHARRPG